MAATLPSVFSPARPIVPLWLNTRANAERLLHRVWPRWAPPPTLTTTEWANRYRYLSSEGSARPGKYDASVTPWVVGIHEALDDPRVYKVVCMKAAQVAWTDGVLNNYLGRRIHVDPCPAILMFPKEGAAKEFSDEKFSPMVRATPVLRERVDVSSSRKTGNRALYKSFSGGFLKLVGSNSTSSVKSTPAPFIAVEEPDDANSNVKRQGDAIKLLEERTKTYSRRKILIGGTPTIKGLSTIEDEYQNSDQRKPYVPCHECGEFHVLAWGNVSWIEDAQRTHEVYGHARPETARYTCPHCGVAWTDRDKQRNVARMEWRATAEFRGVAGFGGLSELYVSWENSTLSRLVERHLEAKRKESQGDDSDIIVFWNSALGLPYEYTSDAPDADALRERAENYPELAVPEGGLLLTAGVDAQHDRLAVVIRAWGRGEESWLVYWGELFGTVTDKKDLVWRELDRMLLTPIKHARGIEMRIRALSFDSSDGKTSDAVYNWVREKNRLGHHGIMAVKGGSERHGRGSNRDASSLEIFSTPRKSVDHRTPTKASRFGLRPFIVGTTKAKDLIGGWLKLTGHGPGRFHFYQDVRSDYFDQMTAEVKAPSRRHRGRLVWQIKAGRRNEAFDCEVYALHAARSLKTHIMTPAQWDALERRLSQSDLFSAAAKQPAENKKPATPAAKPERVPQPSEFGSPDWEL